MKHYDGEIGGLLGEFQFAYLAFVIGQVKRENVLTCEPRRKGLRLIFVSFR